ADLVELLVYFDVDSHVAAMDEQGLSEIISGPNRSRFGREYKEDLRPSRFSGFAWKSLVVRHVTPTTADDVVVFAKAVTTAGADGRYKIWVKRTGGLWRVYDLEDQDVGARISAYAVAGGRVGLREPAMIEHLQELQKALSAARTGDVAERNKQLKKLEE